MKTENSSHSDHHSDQITPTEETYRTIISKLQAENQQLKDDIARLKWAAEEHD